MSRLLSKLLAGVMALSCGVAIAQTSAPASQPAATQPASTQPAEDDALRAQLDALEHKARDIHDLTASFTQSRHSPILRKPLVSQGTVNILGGQTRWTTLKPRPGVMLTTQQEIQLYYPQQQVVEVYPLDRKLSELVASPLPRVETLRRHFTITRIDAGKSGLPTADAPTDALCLRLTPRDEQIAQHISRIDVMIDPATALASVMAMTNPDGDRTLLTFSQVRVNVGLAKSDLRIDAPAGTRYVRPLDAKPAR